MSEKIDDTTDATPSVHIDSRDFQTEETTGVYFATDDSRRGIMDEAWENNGCMPSSNKPLPKDFFKDCEMTKTQIYRAARNIFSV